MGEQGTTSAWIRRRRKALDLTQNQLAQRIGCATVTLRKIETGERRPSNELAERLAAALELVGEERAVFLKAARGAAWVDKIIVPLLPLPSTSRPSQEHRHAPLPRRRERLIGREREVAAVDALLRSEEIGLVTLTGPGGIGKTRLALQIAAGLHDAFADGVCFVALAPVTNPDLVLPAIAQALGVEATARQPLLVRLRAHLAARHQLLVLDNFEQVVAAARMLCDLLQAAPRLKLLVTSREGLQVYGERAYPVQPLALPDPARSYRADDILRSPAVDLFLRRAQAVMPDFQLTDTNAPAVAAICTRLDGLPLAIELAAARIRLFTPQELVQRLEHRLQTLTGGPRDRAARQHTLRNTIDWSYTLLRPAEQHLFAALGVFGGDWTLQAAEEVCRVPGTLDINVPDSLLALVNKSLVQQHDIDGVMRFMMLETIREYAQERLAERGQAGRVRDQYMRYYLAWLEAMHERAQRGQPVELAGRLHAEMPNLVATLQWIRDDGDLEFGVRWHDATWMFGSIPRLAPGLEPALDRWQPPLRDRHTPMPAHMRAKGLILCGRIAWFQGDLPQAAALLEDGLAVARTQADPVEITDALMYLGDVYRDQEQYAQAALVYAESLAQYEALGRPELIAAVYHTLGELALLQGDYQRAVTLEQGSLTRFRALGVGWGIAAARINQGFAVQHLGDDTTAARCFGESLTVAWGLQNMPLCMASLVGFAAVATPWDPHAHQCMHGLDRAARLLGATEAIQEMSGETMVRAHRLAYERIIADIRGRLDAAVWTAAWRAGQAMTLDQAITYALEGVEASTGGSQPVL